MFLFPRFGFTPAVRKLMHFEDHKRLGTFDTGDLLEIVIEERDEVSSIPTKHFCKKIEIAGSLEEIGDFG